jgi:hypothetical protein
VRPEARERLTRLLWRAALATVTVALVATLAFALGTLDRPRNNVEGCVLFEASRIRSGLPLYIDPAAGAFDYGPVPARYYVLYPPVFSWLLSLLPAGAAAWAAHAFGVAAWFGLLGWIASRADAACRKAAWLAAAFAGGVYSLALFGASGRPDALAVLLAGVALGRSARRGRVDVVSAALFAAAPFIKPNVVSLAAGAFVVDLALRRVRALPSLAVAILVTVAFAATLQQASHGAWVSHLLLSTAQPLSLPQWTDQVSSRVQFFAAPLALAVLAGARARKDPRAAIALGGLAAGIAWAILSAAKIGSASNYWMEPWVAAIALLGLAPVPAVAPRFRLVAAAGVLLQALWSGVASVRSSYEQLALEVPDHRRAVARAREVCGARPGELVMGDEVGLELAMDGRILTTPFQMTHLVRRGSFPVAAWLADVRRPEVVGAVMEDDLLERPLGEINVEHDRLPPQLRSALKERFVKVEQNGEWRTYCDARRSR